MTEDNSDNNNSNNKQIKIYPLHDEYDKGIASPKPKKYANMLSLFVWSGIIFWIFILWVLFVK